MNRIRLSKLKADLVAAQRAREYLPIEGGKVLDWRHYEMLTMLKSVNMMRQGHDRPFVTFADIEWAEGQARGHIDYTKKFALHCAELVDK